MPRQDRFLHEKLQRMADDGVGMTKEARSILEGIRYLNLKGLQHN
jgi:hypothetical protein